MFKSLDVNHFREPSLWVASSERETLSFGASVEGGVSSRQGEKLCGGHENICCSFLNVELDSERIRTCLCTE